MSLVLTHCLESVHDGAVNHNTINNACLFYSQLPQLPDLIRHLNLIELRDLVVAAGYYLVTWWEVVFHRPRSIY